MGLVGAVIMDPSTTKDEQELLKALDKGIDDIEASRLTLHEDSIELLRQSLEDYALQHQGN